jgi:hypothetical protein
VPKTSSFRRALSCFAFVVLAACGSEPAASDTLDFSCSTTRSKCEPKPVGDSLPDEAIVPLVITPKQCSEAEIWDYTTGCMDASGMESKCDGGVVSPACGACLAGAQLVLGNRPNVAGCMVSLAAEKDKPCVPHVASLLDCVTAACSSCDSYELNATCAVEAQRSVCKSARDRARCADDAHGSWDACLRGADALGKIENLARLACGGAPSSQ